MLAVERSLAVDAGGVMLVACVRPVVAHGGRVWFSWALVVVWGWCVLRASCCWVVVVICWTVVVVLGWLGLGQ